MRYFRKFETSLSADLQQRSCEFLEILEPDWDSNRSGILERMPVPERDLSNVGTGDTSIDEVWYDAVIVVHSVVSLCLMFPSCNSSVF